VRPATGTAIDDDDPRALARRALGLAVRCSPSWSGGASEANELSRRHPTAFDRATVDAAIAFVGTVTRPGPIADQAVALLVKLRQPSHATPLRPDDPAAPAASVSAVEPSEAPPILSIVTIEGRGIWIELAGAYLDGACDAVAARLAQLGGLAFTVAVLDVRRLDALDDVGSRSILQFVEPIVEARGRVHVVDPEGRAGDLVDSWWPGIVHIGEPPSGTWWT
jgi:hypothetical protein